MKKLMLPVGCLVSALTLTGCSVLSVKSPTGYEVRRYSFLAWYELHELTIQTSNTTVRVGGLVSGGDTNAIHEANTLVETAVSAAVKAGIKGAAL